MKEKLYRFMQGRHGVDTLNHVSVIVCIVIFVLDIFIQSIFLKIIGYILWFMVIYRMFSKQIYKRSLENQKFLQFIAPITRLQNLYQKRRQDPTHKYYRCPSCHQIVRLPKGHGKVIVTCPKCSTKFERRT